MRFAVAVLLFLSTSFAAFAEGHFRILELNDVYKIEGLENGSIGGMARIRTERLRLEADGTPVLLLHAGDAIFPSVMSKYLAARPIVRVMNMLDGTPGGFDRRMIATLGNHELEKDDPLYTLGRLAESDFRWVASNVHYCSSGNCEQTFADRLTNVFDTVIVDGGNVPVGIFALTVDSGNKDYFRIDHNDETARWAAVRKAIDSLKARGARVLIALTHQDFVDDIAMAEKFPEIDAVVGGHDHQYVQQTVGHTVIAKGDADARSVIAWDIQVPDDGGLPVIKTERVMLDATVPKDAAVDKEVQRWMDALAKILGPNDEIGQTANLLEGVEPAVRGRETALGNFLADVAKDWMKTDVGFVNGGSIRINDNIPPGPVRKYDMEGIFYYGNALVAFDVTGAQLTQMLNDAVARVDVGDGRFLQVGGVKFSYKGGPPFEVTDVQVKRRGSSKYAPVDPKATYSVATLQYIYDNGGNEGFSTLKNGPSKPKITIAADPVKNDFRKATETTIKALPNQTITTAIEGRIVHVE
ncbi:MAG: bifunctional metallophosphatase/5'-nucleotidase [Acidobacteria bacterium]|nr:bifunctional metallophosphatase/5'-nucleotidase [Acidobacteriota bacterium]